MYYKNRFSIINCEVVTCTGIFLLQESQELEERGIREGACGHVMDGDKISGEKPILSMITEQWTQA